MNKYVYRTLCDNYEAAARAMVVEFRRTRHDFSLMVTEVGNAYRESLAMLRLFLDSEGMIMPKPKWRYNHHDESTWLYTMRQDVNKSFMMLQARRK